MDKQCGNFRGIIERYNTEDSGDGGYFGESAMCVIHDTLGNSSSGPSLLVLTAPPLSKMRCYLGAGPRCLYL